MPRLKWARVGVGVQKWARGGDAGGTWEGRAPGRPGKRRPWTGGREVNTESHGGQETALDPTHSALKWRDWVKITWETGCKIGNTGLVGKEVRGKWDSFAKELGSLE